MPWAPATGMIRDMTLPLTQEQIVGARALIDPVYLDTPLVRQPALDAALGCTVALKVESLGPLRSFKGRGVEALMGSLSSLPERVVTTSSGNFGQAVARAATRRGIAATIFCEAGANPSKVVAMQAFGAEVREIARDVDHKEIARQHARATDALFIEDGAHLEIAAGAGTIAQEVTAKISGIDVFLVQIGDGALISGIGSWIKAVSPKTEVIGVTAEGAPAMRDSLKAGKSMAGPTDTLADGMAISRPIESAVRQVASVVDEVLTIDDATMLEAMALLLDRTGLVAEPSGAAGVVAVTKNRERFRGRNVAAVLTGGNIHPGLWSKILPVTRSS